MILIIVTTSGDVTNKIGTEFLIRYRIVSVCLRILQGATGKNSMDGGT